MPLVTHQGSFIAKRGALAPLLFENQSFLTTRLQLFSVAPEVLDIAEMICAKGSAAAEELEDLLLDAMTFDDGEGPEEG